MKILLILTLAAILIAADAKPVQLVTPQQRAVLQRRRAVAREVIEMDGKRYAVVTYMRGAKPDGVETNECVSIVGAVQNNPLENALKELRTHYGAATNRVANLEARRDNIIAWATAKRDEAALQTTKAIWQAVIDRIQAEEGSDE